jgi:hypothetical protein
MGTSLAAGRYRCLFSDSRVSATRDPGDVASEFLAEIKHGGVEGQIANGGPQFELVAE